MRDIARNEKRLSIFTSRVPSRPPKRRENYFETVLLQFSMIFLVSRGRNKRGYKINDFSVWLFLWGSHFSRVLKNDDAGTTGVSWARSQPASLLAGRLAGWLAWDASGKHKTPEPGGAWGSLQCEVGIDSGGGVTWPQVG